MKEILHHIENVIEQPNLLFSDYQILARMMISAVLMYIALIVVFNIFGKRSVSKLSMHDYVATITIGSIISSAIILEDITFFDGLISMLMLMLIQFCLTFLSSRIPKVYDILNPSPKLVFLEGKFLEESMNKNRVTKNEIFAAIRLQGQTTSDNVYAVIHETNGDFSIIKDASDDYKDEILKYK